MPERRRFTPTTLKIAVSKEANAVAQAGARCPRWTLSAASWFAKPAEPRQLPIRLSGSHRTASTWVRSIRNGYLSPIREVFLGAGPKEANCIIAAYEQTLHTLCVKDRDDPLTEMIAKKIIKIAQTGVDDAAQLSALVIADLGVR